MRTALALGLLLLAPGCGSEGGVTTVAPIRYDVSGPFGPNVLAESTGSLAAGESCSLWALLPEDGTLRVRLSGSGRWSLQPSTQRNVFVGPLSRSAAGLSEQSFIFEGVGESGAQLTFEPGAYTVEYAEMSETFTFTRQRSFTVQ